MGFGERNERGNLHRSQFLFIASDHTILPILCFPLEINISDFEPCLCIVIHCQKESMLERISDINGIQSLAGFPMAMDAASVHNQVYSKFSQSLKRKDITH
jgi:hypothetical protein